MAASRAILVAVAARILVAASARNSVTIDNVPASKNCPPREPELSVPTSTAPGVVGGDSTGFVSSTVLSGLRHGISNVCSGTGSVLCVVMAPQHLRGDCTTSMGAVCPNCSGSWWPRQGDIGNAYFPVDQ